MASSQLSDMKNTMRSLRSVLFAPGDSERKLRRALEQPADAVIADFEDAVSPGQKAEARSVTASVFATRSEGPARLVRVNGVGTGLLEDDLASLAGLDLDGIVVPKAEPGFAVPGAPFPVVALIETAAGMKGAGAVAGTPGVRALMLGSIDLGLALGLVPRADGAELMAFRSSLVLESAVAGLLSPLDGVHVDIADLEGLDAQARLARSLGMGGKACIHPSQVPVVNAAFAPSERELEQARMVVDAYARAVRDGSGVIALDGKMIDLPVVEQARRLLAAGGVSGDEGG